MEIALLAAKIYGVVLVALGLGFLINAKYYQKMFADMLKDATFMFMWGIMAVVVGILIILNHNVWEASWVVIVTLIGWIALVKGSFMLIFPGAAKYFEGWFKNKAFFMFAGVVALVLGAVLLYFGF